MNYFENALLMRRAYDLKEGQNDYRIHCFIEKRVVEDAEINSPYSFTYKPDTLNNQVVILTRSSESLGFPGERKKTLHLNDGDEVTFIVSLHTSKSIKTGSAPKKVVAVTDEAERLQKLENVSQKNGFEITSSEQIQDTSIKIKKGRKSFSLAGGLFYVQAKICDKSLFEVAFINGIGRKRNFGYGMITSLEVNND